MATKKKTPEEELLNKNLPQMNPQNLIKTSAAPVKQPTQQPVESPKNTLDVKPKFFRDKDTGKVTGVTLPDGRTITGINAGQASRLANTYLGSAEAKLRPEAPGMTNEQQWKADFEQQQAKEAYIASLTPPNVTPQQLSQVGNINTSAIEQNPNIATSENQFQTTADIITNSEAYKNEGFLSPNKFSGFVTKVPVVGPTLLGYLGQNKRIRDYLNDYSNEGNFGKVSDDIRAAKENLKLSIGEANQPGNSDQAISDYNMALVRLNVARNQLKLIEKYDQRKYVDDVKAKRVELEEYLSKNVPALNTKMQNALLKPDPNWYDAEVAKLVGFE